MKSRKLLFLKLFLTVLVTVLLLRYLNLKQAYSTLRNVKIHYLLAVFLIINLDRVFMAFKWNILLKAKHLNSSLPSLITGYYVSSFLGPILPTTVGDDFVRGFAVSNIGISSENIISSIVVERILGLLSLFLLAFASLAFFGYNRDRDFGNLLLYVGAFLVILTIGFYYSIGNKISKKWIDAKFTKSSGRIRQYLGKAYVSYMDYGHCKKYLVIFFFLTLIEHLAIVYSNYLIMESLGFRISFLDVFCIVPSIMFLSRLPISIGTIGVQEGAYVMLLSLVGLTLTDSVTISIMARVMILLSLLPAFLFILASGRMKIARPA